MTQPTKSNSDETEQRIVTSLPLRELWNSNGVVAAEEHGALNSDDIGQLLRLGKVRFVVADVGRPLYWVPLEQCHTFWKVKVKERLVDPVISESGIFLDEYPGAYCYLASAWQPDTGERIVLLSKFH